MGDSQRSHVQVLPTSRRGFVRTSDPQLTTPAAPAADIVNPSEGPTLLVSLFPIPAGDLAIALTSAQLDPDGQVFPWRPLYPLVGSTVLHDGRLWTVSSKERGAGGDSPIAMVRLIGQGHDSEAIATRSELRPVLWTSEQEAEYQAAHPNPALQLQWIAVLVF